MLANHPLAETLGEYLRYTINLEESGDPITLQDSLRSRRPSATGPMNQETHKSGLRLSYVQSLAILPFFLRLASRFILNHSLALDDWFIIAAAVSQFPPVLVCAKSVVEVILGLGTGQWC
jgi:hypothetical protein